MSVTIPSPAAATIIEQLVATNTALATANGELAAALASGAGGNGEQATFDLNAIGSEVSTLVATANEIASAITAASSGSAGPAAFTISTTSLPDAAVGQSYSVQVDVDGGVDPITFSASGLPAGLSQDSTTGLISGTVSAAGTSSVVLSATDSTTPTPLTTPSVTLTLNAA